MLAMPSHKMHGPTTTGRQHPWVMHLSEGNSKEKRSEWNVFHSYLTWKPTSGASIVVSVNTLQLARSGSYIIFVCGCEVEGYFEVVV
jgi:hypothetical protein